ncbi:site-specific integrase [Brevibacillus sp. 7WMA2]|uniref:site-specific integrase n=1 Tax=Brevibacillus sp. 7WMA2 TaxID=2683193 RepID=UPI0013A74ABF|nr:site-specific integrase [Brevibacillus sp. 7WMA2]QIC06424.1 site-specific integrase [Brevibacillus sp. 7WMA2]
MKVQEVRLEDHFGVTKSRYIPLNLDNQPIVPVVKYLKYLDKLSKAENTLKSYCYHLMLYFKFLDEEGKVYEDVSLDLLSDFIGWLRHAQEDWHLARAALFARATDG